MNINFENLEKIEVILQKLHEVDSKVSNIKRWMNTDEIALYLGYSKDSIDSMVRLGELKKGVHYYQKRRKRIFDKLAIDNWVMESKNNIDNIVDEIISSISS